MWWNGRRGRLKIYFRQLSAGSSPVIGNLRKGNIFNTMKCFLFCFNRQNFLKNFLSTLPLKAQAFKDYSLGLCPTRCLSFQNLKNKILFVFNKYLHNFNTLKYKLF